MDLSGPWVALVLIIAARLWVMIPLYVGRILAGRPTEQTSKEVIMSLSYSKWEQTNRAMKEIIAGIDNLGPPFHQDSILRPLVLVANVLFEVYRRGI